MKHHHRNHHKLWHETLFRPLALHCTQWCTHTILHSLPPPLATRLYKNVQYVLRNKLWTSSWSVLPSCYQVYSIFSLTSGVHAQVGKYVGQAFRKNGTTSGSHVIFQQNLRFCNGINCNATNTKHKAVTIINQESIICSLNSFRIKYTKRRILRILLSNRSFKDDWTFDSDIQEFPISMFPK